MIKPSSWLAFMLKPLLATFTLALVCTASFSQTVQFSANVTSGCFPITVHFTDNSTGFGSPSSTSWAWTFGNGNTSSIQHPDATYTGPGTYNVSLTVSNGTQTKTETKNGYIVVHDFPVVDFSFDKSSGCTPLEVKFKDESTNPSGNLTSWFWVFGDGATSIQRNPAYTYLTPGTKNITLKVTNEFGCHRTQVKNNAISIQGPDAKFIASSTSVCQVPATIQFTNQSTGTGTLTYAWNFGDGKTSTEASPSNTYASSGSFTVNLKTKDALGCESSISQTINVGNQDGLNFQPSASPICIGQTVSFNVQANTAMLSHEWNFGNGATSTDEHPTVQYDTPGTYSITLKAMLQGNSCQSLVTRTVEVLGTPEPSFTFKADCNYGVTLTSTATGATRQEWYVGNILYSTASVYSHSFNISGDHTVKFIAYNALNCSKSLEKVIDIPAKPVASFLPFQQQDCKAPSLSGCAPFTIAFENTSFANSAFTSEWKFGDGATSASTEKDPTHTYTTKGLYTLTLKITNSQNCSSVATAKVDVSDVTPEANFTLDKTIVCSRDTVKFKDNSKNATFWCWDFGDGSTSTTKDAHHIYTKSGTYTVKLTAKNAGCASSFEIKNAVVVKGPDVDFKVFKNCTDPYKVTLDNLSSGHTSLKWDFGDGAQATADVPNHTYASTGPYKIGLTVADPVTGCSPKYEIPVFIQDVKADFEVDNVKPCKGAPVKFTDKSISAARWQWSFGNNMSSTAQHPQVAFYLAGQLNVTLNVFDSDGCSDQKVLPLSVLDIEGRFSFTATSTCDKLTVKFKDESLANPPVLNWNWDFGDTKTSTDKNPVNVYENLGLYPITLTLTNTNGTCSFIRYDAIGFTNPVASFSASKNTFCIDEKVTFTNKSVDANRFEWNFGNGVTVTDLHAQASYSSTGTYKVELKAWDKYGCQKSALTDVTVTKPVASFDATDTSSDCPPLTTLFHDKSTGNVKAWQWDFGEGNFSVFQNPAHTYIKPGNFDIKLKVTDGNGCTDVTTSEKLVTVGGPYGSYTSTATDFCLNTLVAFTANTTNATIHRWDFGDGVVEDLSTLTTTHFYSNVGSYTPSLVLFDANGCKVLADGNTKIVIQDTTAVDFDYEPKCIFSGGPFTLKAEGPADIHWSWEIEGQAVGTNQTQQVVLDSAGIHHVVLRAVNNVGCISTVIREVPVQGELKFIPNVFTPNGDSYNAFFVIPGVEKANWNLHIYNRWGEEVFNRKNYRSNWNGEDLPAGVYFYFLSNGLCKDRTYKGPLSILK